MKTINKKQKCFSNSICEACISKNIKKYNLQTNGNLVEWHIDCKGISIEEDVKLALKEGLDEHQARMMFDPLYYFEKRYKSKPRWYQKGLLCCTSRNIAGRFCRQTGKTLSAMNRIFQFVETNADKTVLIITPRESQIKKIWDEYIFRDWYDKNEEVRESIGRNYSQSPYYNIKLDNGSKIILMIAGPGARSQTADWIYMDEAALIPKEELNAIMGTILSRGDDSFIILTSTPKGRGNMFYDACMTDAAFNEYHVSIYDVEEIKSQAERFKKILGADGFMQEAEALFPSSSSGPFNYDGIDLAKMDYEYGPSNIINIPGELYFGGVDWNGPNIGTYFYIVGFNPDTFNIRIVDKKVVASAVWNQQVAKTTFIELNRKWKPKHWMTDFGYGHGVNEELKFWSTYKLPIQNYPDKPADLMVKHILEPVEFGSWIEIEDPFTKEIIKKTCKSFIISQVSKLFEPNGGNVHICFPKDDDELIKSLENYRLLQITDRGVEKYGFEKGSGIEDHCIDALLLALYGIIKHYSDLFKKIFTYSVPIDAKALLGLKTDINNEIKIPQGAGIVLLTDNSPEPIYLDDKAWKEPIEDRVFISRSFNRGMSKSRLTLESVMKKRNQHIINRSIN